MKNKFNKWLLTTAVVFGILVTANQNGLSAGQIPEAAPLNPDFVNYLNSRQIDKVSAVTGSANRFGSIPPSVVPSSSPEFQAGRNLDGVILPVSYDLRTDSRLPPIKDQSVCGACWAFAAMGSLESWLWADNEDPDYSENNLKNLHGFDWGACEGGNALMAAAYFTRWSGPVRETADPYYPASPPPPVYPISAPLQKHVQEVIILPPLFSVAALDQIKNIIYQNKTAVKISMCWERTTTSSTTHYNSTTHSYNLGRPLAFDCNGENQTTSHDITLVGWDDNWSKTNFSTVPAGNGAFIARNSWGSTWGDSGYFYISYYDSRVALYPAAFINAESVTNYDFIYQYDLLGKIDKIGCGSDSAWMANSFKVSNSQTETLEACAFYTTGPNTHYDIFVFIGGIFVGPLSGSITLSGYHTISLKSLGVTLVKDEDFGIYVKLTTPSATDPIPVERKINGFSTAAVASHKSFLSCNNGEDWVDVSTISGVTNANLKAFTSTCVPDCSGKCGGSDGCNGTCPNNCAAPQVCFNDICCTPESDQTFCSNLGKNCGNVTAPDNCGVSRIANCGTCTDPAECESGKCVVPDGGTADGGKIDGGVQDGGTPDSGTTDGGETDGGSDGGGDKPGGGGCSMVEVTQDMPGTVAGLLALFGIISVMVITRRKR